MLRAIRKGSQSYKVDFGQTETTNLLANNRELGKVSPSATMEFDLPRREILVREGIDSALAFYNDAGALIQDPSFLALADMKQQGMKQRGMKQGGVPLLEDILGIGALCKPLPSDEKSLQQNTEYCYGPSDHLSDALRFDGLAMGTCGFGCGYHAAIESRVHCT